MGQRYQRCAKGRYKRIFQELFGCHCLLLACLEMRLTHSVRNVPLVLAAPLAEDFNRLVDALYSGAQYQQQ